MINLIMRLTKSGKWWVHIRVKDQSLLASKVVVDVLRKQSSEEYNQIEYSSKEQFFTQLP